MQEFEITFDNHKFYTYSSQMFEMCLFLVFFLHQYKLERTFLGKSCLNYWIINVYGIELQIRVWLWQMGWLISLFLRHRCRACHCQTETRPSVRPLNSSPTISAAAKLKVTCTGDPRLLCSLTLTNRDSAGWQAERGPVKLKDALYFNSKFRIKLKKQFNGCCLGTPVYNMYINIWSLLMD